MTRPRYVADECSWRVVEQRVTNEKPAAPVSTRAAQANGTEDASAVAVRLTPKAADVATRYGRRGCWMRPTPSEPTMEPRLSMVDSSPYVPPDPWKVFLARTGSTTAKLNARSPTRAIITKGNHNCCLL